MSQVRKAIDDYIENKLYNLHTAFLAKVISKSGKEYSVKPLCKVKEYGLNAEEAPVIQGVYAIKSSETIAVGNIVLCVAHERDLSGVLNGQYTIPLSGVRHSLNDAIIVGVMDI